MINTEGLKEAVAQKGKKFIHDAINWLKVDPPLDESTPYKLLEEFSERQSLLSTLYYRDISKNGLITFDDGKEIRLGFMLEFMPFLVVGTDAELQMETIISSVKVPDAVMQFGVLSHNFVSPTLVRWQRAKKKSGDPMIDKIADFRKNYFLAAAYKTNLISGTPSHPKEHSFLLTVTFPYKGDIHDEYEWQEFHNMVLNQRDSVLGVLQGAKLPAFALEREHIKFYLRIMLNPHIPADKLARVPYDEVGVTDLVMKNNRLTVDEEGILEFSESDAKKEKKAVLCMTLDGYPKSTYLPGTAKLLGDFKSAHENIPDPFWMYLNIRILDSGKAKEKLEIKLAGVTRQLVSDSPAYKALMSHLFEQRDQLQGLVDLANDGASLVTTYMGMNVFTQKENAANLSKSISGMWAGHGYRGSQETFISFPIWFSSLPGLFFPKADPTNFKGLQRSSTMTTTHASRLPPVQGDWKGTNPENGGLLMTARRGQMATFNIMDKAAVPNYNFAIVAASGMGKSFVAQEIVSDFLSKGGMAFVIDAGRSYYEMCELLNGVNLVFNPKEAFDINPFAQIKDEVELKVMLENLKELLAYMAWPQSVDSKIPDWEYVLLSQAIEECWHEKKEKTIIRDIRDWLASHEDKRAHDIADQLRPYAEGTFAHWFDGTGKKINLNNRFVVIELDDLKSQGAFRDVVLTMMMQRIADIMYKTKDPSQPKLMLIDEAWDLLASNQAAGFINRAYRTYRKFGGSAGVITQSFGDFKMSEAAKAAWDNSSWLFALGQKAESLQAAFNEKLLVVDDFTKDLLSTVHTIPGKYSEIFVRAGDSGQGVYRFIVDRYTYWLYTSNGEEKAKRKQMFDKIKSENPDMTYQEAMAKAIATLADMDYKESIGKSPREIVKELGID
ncbi:TraG/VirB4 family ATPase [Galenea microaerophila]